MADAAKKKPIPTTMTVVFDDRELRTFQLERAHKVCLMQT